MERKANIEEDEERKNLARRKEDACNQHACQEERRCQMRTKRYGYKVGEKKKTDMLEESVGGGGALFEDHGALTMVVAESAMSENTEGSVVSNEDNY